MLDFFRVGGKVLRKGEGVERLPCRVPRKLLCMVVGYMPRSRPAPPLALHRRPPQGPVICYSPAMEIVQDGNPVLRARAAPVEEREFGTKEWSDLMQQMIDALDKEEDGVALAAPQIGIGKRIFVVRYDRMHPPPLPDEAPRPREVGVYVNPQIIRSSRKKSDMDEGCLSVRGTYGTTVRFERATVRAQDEHGNVFERGGGGILAQAFQHEIDHLNGILFTDHAKNTYEHTREHA